MKLIHIEIDHFLNEEPKSAWFRIYSSLVQEGWKGLIRKQWWADWHVGLTFYKNKPLRPSFYVCFYDGYHWVFHIGPFYIGRSNYWF